MRAKAIGHLYEAKDVTITFKDGHRLRVPSGEVIVGRTHGDFTVGINQGEPIGASPVETIHRAIRSLWNSGRPPKPFIQCGRCLARLDQCACGLADEVRQSLADHEARERMREAERERTEHRATFVRHMARPSAAPTRVGADLPAEALLPRMNRHERRAERARNRKR